MDRNDRRRQKRKQSTEKQKEAMKELECRRDALQQQLDELEQHHASLQQQHKIVTALCDSLLYVQVQEQQEHLLEHARQQLQHRQQNGMPSVTLQLLEVEGLLLRALPSLPPASLEALQAASMDGQGLPTISPADDPMALAKDMSSRPVFEGALSMTSLDLTLLYKTMATELAVHLQLLDASMLTPEACSGRIKQSSDRLLHCLTSCLLMNRNTMIKAHLATHLETLGDPDAAALTSHFPNVLAAASKLQLTPAQQQAIAGHWRVWRGLIAPVNAEIAQLQQQIQQLSRQDIGALKNSSSTASSDKGTSSATAAPAAWSSAATASQGTSMDIMFQMQLVDRLQVVLRKKHIIISFACIAFFVGRLSWVQFARMVVLSWPFPVSFELACMAVEQVAQHPEEQREQQQQQQHKEVQQ